MKNLAAFCSCPENLLDKILKSIGSISLVEEILRRHNGESVAQLLLISLMQAYSEHNKQQRKKWRPYGMEREGTLGSSMLKPKPALTAKLPISKEIRPTEKTLALHWNKGVPWASPHLATFQLLQ